MLTDFFLDECFSIILAKETKIKKHKALFRDILEILNDYKKKEKDTNIPINIKGKLDCLIKICELSIQDKDINTILDSLLISERYKQFYEYLTDKTSLIMNEFQSENFVNHLRLRKKLITLFSNYNQLNKVLETIKDGSFDSLDNIVLDYEQTVKQLYYNVMENNRNISIEASASLDLEKDDYSSIIEQIKKKYERVNTTPSGYNVFDNDIFPNGGFEGGRLYLFCGSPGSGKSTILTNLISKSTTCPYFKINNDKRKKVYVYITLENTIEESLLRIYGCLFEKSIPEILKDIQNGIDIKKKIMDVLNETNSTIILKYFPATTISPVDCMIILDDVISEYGRDSIMGLYIDYLDLLKLDVKYDLYRLELGHITVSLKNIAVHYDIPVISASQLGKSSYNIKTSNDLGLDQISESIKKVENADFVCLLSKDNINDSLVHAKIGKNRSGKSGVPMDFKVNFEHFNFISGNRVSINKDENNSIESISSTGKSVWNNIKETKKINSLPNFGVSL